MFYIRISRVHVLSTCGQGAETRRVNAGADIRVVRKRERNSLCIHLPLQDERNPEGGVWTQRRDSAARGGVAETRPGMDTGHRRLHEAIRTARALLKVALALISRELLYGPSLIPLSVQVSTFLIQNSYYRYA